MDMRKTLLLQEFINTKCFGDIQRLVEDSLKLRKLDKALFESVHDTATDGTYKEHALRLIAKMKICADRNDENRDISMKSHLLALRNLSDYFSSRPNNADFVAMLNTNIANAQKTLESGGNIPFEPKFIQGNDPGAEAKARSKYLRAAMETPGLFPRLEPSA